MIMVNHKNVIMMCKYSMLEKNAEHLPSPNKSLATPNTSKIIKTLLQSLKWSKYLWNHQNYENTSKTSQRLKKSLLFFMRKSIK